MSVRAYKILATAESPTFNLWHDKFFMKLFEEAIGFESLNEGVGTFEISEEKLAEMEELYKKYKKEFSKEEQKETLEIFERIKEDFEGGYANYTAY